MIRIANGEYTGHPFLSECGIGGFVDVHTDGQDGNLVAHLLLQGNKFGDFLYAWGTPCGPEVEQYGLATELAELDRLLSVVDRKVGSRSADLRRFGVAA